MQFERARLKVNVGNLLELVGAGAAVRGVDLIVGVGYALIVAAVLMIVAAELIYDGHVWSIPLPHRPRPWQRLSRLVQDLRFRLFRARRRYARRGVAGRASR